MTAQHTTLVRDSFEGIREMASPVILLFYGRLFDLDPSLRAMFKIDMRTQAEKLTNMLATLVDSLDRMDELRPMLRELGVRHADYGVQPEHYRTLNSALLWAFGQALDQDFQPDVRQAWSALLSEVEAAMLGAPEPVTSRL